MRALKRPAMAWLLVSAALLLCAGCGDNDIRAIEKLGPAALPELPPAVLPEPVLPLERGRVQVRDGNLFTDKGTRLRGVTVGVDHSPDFPFDQALFDELAGTAGLNALHVYLENYRIPTGARVAQADRLVEFTALAGMYLVIGIGGGDAGGSFDLANLRAFWGFYAPRYGHRTHVLFEVHNLPEPGCDIPRRPETLAMQLEAHDLIRAVAPDSHLLLLSYVATPAPAALASSLDALGTSVDWSKASVAFHSRPDCVALLDLPQVLEVTRSRRIAAVSTEVTLDATAEETSRLEASQLGWFNFHWIQQDQDLSAFREFHTAGGVSWCPDFGSWPEPAGLCRAP